MSTRADDVMTHAVAAGSVSDVAASWANELAGERKTKARARHAADLIVVPERMVGGSGEWRSVRFVLGESRRRFISSRRPYMPLSTQRCYSIAPPESVQ